VRHQGSGAGNERVAILTGGWRCAVGCPRGTFTLSVKIGIRPVRHVRRSECLCCGMFSVAVLRRDSAARRKIKPLSLSSRMEPLASSQAVPPSSPDTVCEIKTRFLQIIQVPVRAMAHLCPQLSFDRSRIRVMPVSGHPLWHTTGDGPRRAEERFGRRHISGLAQQHIDEIPIPINRPIQLHPPALHFAVGFVRIPTRPDASSPVLPQRLAQERGELRLPPPHRLVRKD
jgi:hypothetical protein